MNIKLFLFLAHYWHSYWLHSTSMMITSIVVTMCNSMLYVDFHIFIGAPYMSRREIF